MAVISQDFKGIIGKRLMVVKGIICVHPETTDFRMELSAVRNQQSANTLFFCVLAESRKLMADSTNLKTPVFG